MKYFRYDCRENRYVVLAKNFEKLRCFGQGNLYPSQRATMGLAIQEIDRIMPVGSLIPWIPRLNISDGSMASYLPAKGWIKCDGKEICDQRSCTIMRIATK